MSKKIRGANHSKNVFCLEGLWEKNLKLNPSVEPILALLNKQYHNIKYIHGDCATLTELHFYLEKWIQNRYNAYPVLYLSFHGEESCLHLSDGTIKLSELAEVLEDKCQNRIIIFASCSTLNIDKRILKSFIKKTECLAVCGYQSDVNWFQSTAFELLLLEELQNNEFSGRGIDSIEKKLL